MRPSKRELSNNTEIARLAASKAVQSPPSVTGNNTQGATRFLGLTTEENET